MNNFWSNVSAGTIGAVLSAAAMAAIGELRPLGVHLIIPEDAVIPMSGECPAGWRQYDAANGRYIVAPGGNVPQVQGGHDTATNSVDSSRRDPKATTWPSSSRLFVPGESTYIVLSLCQRR